MDLYNYFLSNVSLPIHKNRHYFTIYAQHFARYVGRPVLFLEIGTGGGGSSRMWRRYFGPSARIVSLDIRPDCAAYAEDQIEIRIGDQSDPAFLDAVIAEFGPPDIVLDDGSHQMAHVTATFRHLYPRMDRNGIYMVEDMHTAYWEHWGGGYRRPGSFLELCKDLIDELNGDHINGPLRPPVWATDAPADVQPTPFTHTTRSMHFYDSVVVFERGHAGPETKRSRVTGDLTVPRG